MKISLLILFGFMLSACFGQPDNGIVGGHLANNELDNSVQSHDSNARIVGGSEATGSYPWMVSIQAGGHFCGGTLIGEYWALTAAHCLEDKEAKNLMLYIGGIRLNSLADIEQRQVDWFVIHPDYNSDSFYSDLALIKLKTPSNQTPISIISQASNDRLLPQEQMRVLGWGVTVEPAGEASNELLQVDVSFQSDSECNDTYPSMGSGDYWQRSLCAGEVSGGKDACQGDSGGPLLVKADGRWALTGVVSWGSGCGLEGFYGVYSEVAFFKGWIEQPFDRVTLLGPDKIGFLGEGRNKSQQYTLLNLGDDAVIKSSSISIGGDYFVIDSANWLFDDVIPRGHQCTFTINALGAHVGEHDGQFMLALDDYTLTQALNSKVLNKADGSALDNQWQWFSGTNDNTEHGLPWTAQNEADAENEYALKSGGISSGERSVLLTYLNGAGGDDNQYLIFDFKLLGEDDHLWVLINEDILTSNLFTKNNIELETGWFTYKAALPNAINHVMFMGLKDGISGSERSVILDNVRICSDPAVEATCSNADGYYNNENIIGLDDPSPNTILDSACISLSDMTYLSRTSDDINLVVKANSKRSGLGFGGVFYLLFLWPLLLIRRFL